MKCRAAIAVVGGALFRLLKILLARQSEPSTPTCHANVGRGNVMETLRSSSYVRIGQSNETRHTQLKFLVAYTCTYDMYVVSYTICGLQ